MGVRSFFGGIVVSGILVWSGVQGIYTSMSNPKPNEKPCADFNKSQEDSSWFRLKGCPIELDEAVYFVDKKNQSKIVELYVPVRFEEGQPVRIAIASKDPGWIATYGQLLEKSKKGTEEMNAWFEENVDKFRFESDIDGLVKWGFSSDDHERKEFEKKSEPVAANLLVLSHHEEPSMGLGLFLSCLGLGGFGMTGLRALRRHG